MKYIILQPLGKAFMPMGKSFCLNEIYAEISFTIIYQIEVFRVLQEFFVFMYKIYIYTDRNFVTWVN